MQLDMCTFPHGILAPWDHIGCMEHLHHHSLKRSPNLWLPSPMHILHVLCQTSGYDDIWITEWLESIDGSK